MMFMSLAIDKSVNYHCQYRLFILTFRIIGLTKQNLKLKTKMKITQLT